MSNNINTLIQNAQQTGQQAVEAQQQAATQAVVQDQGVQPQVQENTALATVPAHIAALAQPKKMSMATMQQASLQADAWLKFSFYGITTNVDDKTLLDEVEVEINMTENSGDGYFLCEMVKWGNPSTYVHTYDGLTGSDGRPWVESVQTAYNNNNPQAKKPNTPYPAVQLPMTLTKDIVNKKGEVIVTKGSVVGYTTARTAWYNWQRFYTAVGQAGKLGQRVQVKITNDATEFNTNKWGVPKFELL
jgi:hypothetical protein